MPPAIFFEEQPIIAGKSRKFANRRRNVKCSLNSTVEIQLVIDVRVDRGVHEVGEINLDLKFEKIH